MVIPENRRPLQWERLAEEKYRACQDNTLYQYGMNTEWGALQNPTPHVRTRDGAEPYNQPDANHG